jgi:hypothetical protein
MLRWFLQRQIAAFERTWNYDAGYIHEVIDVDPRAMLAFGKLQAISGYRKGVPPAAYFAAGIVAVMTEDCGPCTQLAIDMAQQAGVDPRCCGPRNARLQGDARRGGAGRAIHRGDFAARPRSR